MTGDELAAEARSLRADVGELAGAVQGLADRSNRADQTVLRTVRRTKRAVIWLVVSIVLDLGLTGWVTLTNWRQDRTDSRVDQNQAQIVANQAQITAIQQRTSAEVLCPLYRIFLASYRPEAQPPERRAEYEANFAVIRKSYEVLDCG